MKHVKLNTRILQIGLVISGVTAFFIPQGLSFLANVTQAAIPDHHLSHWILSLENIALTLDTHAPSFWYGCDWLAFAHILFALLFQGLYKDPVRNYWLIDFGLIACILILPTAFIMGEIRQIPLIWRVLDCGFGFIAAIVLYRIKTLTQELINQRIAS